MSDLKELKDKVIEVVETKMAETKTSIDDLKAKAAEQEEMNAKLLEANKELKAQYDALQDKTFKLNGNTGSNLYTFKGYDVSQPNRNFKIACTVDQREEAAASLLKMWKACAGRVEKDLTTANTGAYAVPVEYGSALLGLAELGSYALSRCRIIRYPGEVMYLPSKGTRATTDAQQHGTANAAAATTLGRLTFTIDKRVGAYETLWNNVLRQSNFDVIGEFVEPVMAESIGQRFDDYMFNGSSEFTTTIIGGGTSGATFSGTIGSSSITYAGLVDVEISVEQERGVNPEWCMPRGVYGRIRKLVDTYGRPLVDRAMEAPLKSELMGYPLFIVPAISASPANGALCLAFGDPRRYIIGINQELMFHINPYVEMKESKTLFIMEATADGNIESATAWSYYKRNDA